MLTGCTDKNAFTVTVPVAEQFRGQTIVAVDNVSGDTLAMATATDSIVVLKGSIEKPVFAIVCASQQPISPVIIEPGNITLTGNGATATGTPSNDQYAELIANSMNEDADGDSLLRNFFISYPDNPWALPLLQAFSYVATTEVLDTLCAHNPDLTQDPSAIKLRQTVENRQHTEAGNHYVDFTLANAKGQEIALSTYVDAAPLTIVDFWASWCGPCRAEIPNLVELYNKYHSKGLQIVGIDVWEQDDQAGPDAVKEMKIPYPVLYGGTQETTDLYGIVGIPTILIIDGQGTIIARNVRGEEIGEIVAAQLN